MTMYDELFIILLMGIAAWAILEGVRQFFKWWITK